MFSSCYEFNQPITIPKSVIHCDRMFYNCGTLKQHIKVPHTAKYRKLMFVGCPATWEVTYSLNKDSTPMIEAEDPPVEYTNFFN